MEGGKKAPFSSNLYYKATTYIIPYSKSTQVLVYTWLHQWWLISKQIFQMWSQQRVPRFPHGEFSNLIIQDQYSRKLNHGFYIWTKKQSWNIFWCIFEHWTPIFHKISCSTKSWVDTLNVPAAASIYKCCYEVVSMAELTFTWFENGWKKTKMTKYIIDPTAGEQEHWPESSRWVHL